MGSQVESFFNNDITAYPSGRDVARGRETDTRYSYSGLARRAITVALCGVIVFGGGYKAAQRDAEAAANNKHKQTEHVQEQQTEQKKDPIAERYKDWKIETQEDFDALVENFQSGGLKTTYSSSTKKTEKETETSTRVKVNRTAIRSAAHRFVR